MELELRSCLIYDATRDVLAIAKFLVSKQCRYEHFQYGAGRRAISLRQLSFLFDLVYNFAAVAVKTICMTVTAN